MITNRAIVSTSTGGRGFIVEDSRRRYRYVITAAHCLPHQPPAIGGISYTYECTYQKFLGPLGSKRHGVWAECLFADPVGDIAVLGEPDNQEMSEKADAYGRLVAHRPFTISDVPLPRQKVPAKLLSLDGRWFDCAVENFGRALWIEDVAENIASGMSGSPIIDANGSAVGIVCTSSGPNPHLAAHLPGWLLHELGRRIA
jgi:hypothetical protein